MPVLEVSGLQRFVRDIVLAVGTAKASAEVVADVLVGAHVAGHDSHGLGHLPRYIDEVHAGEIVPGATPGVRVDRSCVARVAGNWAWGHVTADFVIRLATQRAREHGVALVSAVQCNHSGRLGHYVEMAARRGVVTLMFQGGGGVEHPTAAPHGGRKAVLAPNPIAMGFPGAPEWPVVVDIATTRVAGGKVALAQAKGERIPLGWIIDQDGNPSTDPAMFKGAGALLPFGEHKGFGIMVAAEILGRIISGADDFAATEHGGEYFRHCGLTVIAIKGSAFAPSGRVTRRTSDLADQVRAVPPAQGFARVQMPGDFEHANRLERTMSGVDVPDSTWREVLSVARVLGVGSRGLPSA